MKPVYINDEYFGSIYKLFEFENLFFYNNVNYFDQVSRDIILDQKTHRILFDPFAQRSAPYSIINGQIKYLPQLKPIVFNHSELIFDFSKSVRTTNIQNYDYIDDDIFIRKESVLYQLKSVVDQYAGIISISNRALTMKLRSAFKSCDQSTQSLQNLKEYYRQYQSKLKYNITEQRAISSPSHTNINDECSFKLNIQCVDDSSQYYAARKIVKTVFGIPSQQCQFNQSSYFSFHFGMEIILDEIESQTSENQSIITGNIMGMTQLLRQSYLLAGQGKNGQLQYGLIKYLNVPQSTTVKFLSQYLLKRDQSNYQDIQYDEILDQNTQVVIPMMIYDILYSLNDIALFSQATYNLEKLVSDSNVLEIQIGHVFNDQKDLILKNLYTNYYSIYTSQNNASTVAQARFKLFSNILSYFQLHYFTYSSGPNWKTIMKEQLKMQPLGQIQKYRIGQINGNVAITKALLVTNKNLDNQTGVNGFLTLVLNTSFNLQIQGQHTYLDSCTRYISGIENDIYLEGVRHVLSNFQYIQRTRINYTINDYKIIYEINTSFWHDALNRAENNEFIIAVTQGKSVFENYLNQANYDESEMHERTIIFDAKSLYFVSGRLIVKQYGAIDGLIIIYDDIVLNSETNINNIINELNQKQQMDTVDVDKLDYFYYNLTSRVTKTVQSITRRFPANYVKNMQIQYAVDEEVLILFCYSIPLIVIVLFISSKQNRIHYSYKINEQTCEKLSNLILSSSNSIISRLHSVSLIEQLFQQVCGRRLIELRGLFYVINFVETKQCQACQYFHFANNQQNSRKRLQPFNRQITIFVFNIYQNILFVFQITLFIFYKCVCTLLCHFIHQYAFYNTLDTNDILCTNTHICYYIICSRHITHLLLYIHDSVYMLLLLVLQLGLLVGYNLQFFVVQLQFHILLDLFSFNQLCFQHNPLFQFLYILAAIISSKKTHQLILLTQNKQTSLWSNEYIVLETQYFLQVGLQSTPLQLLLQQRTISGCSLGIPRELTNSYIQQGYFTNFDFVYIMVN
ncbi:Conserved_hypothetical protein [Hexamita inflata]|uniref:Uncharacterized protein n=1 Tax=Hexamita inflata TaxID=28002 RepID=A0AA86TCX9_9EUKA|nr:Conserved hypothetical protein [Hexamita inflata]